MGPLPVVHHVPRVHPRARRALLPSYSEYPRPLAPVSPGELPGWAQPLPVYLPPAAAGGLSVADLCRCTGISVVPAAAETVDPCSVCLLGYADDPVARTLLGCSHAFHARCIEQWLSQKSSCPMCRKCVTALDAH